MQKIESIGPSVDRCANAARAPLSLLSAACSRAARQACRTRSASARAEGVDVRAVDPLSDMHQRDARLSARRTYWPSLTAWRFVDLAAGHGRVLVSVVAVLATVGVGLAAWPL